MVSERTILFSPIELKFFGLFTPPEQRKFTLSMSVQTMKRTLPPCIEPEQCGSSGVCKPRQTACVYWPKSTPAIPSL